LVYVLECDDSAVLQIKCGKVTYNNNGGSSIKEGTTASFKCDTGHDLSFVITLGCSNGEWDERSSTCVGKTLFFSSIYQNSILYTVQKSSISSDMYIPLLFWCDIFLVKEIFMY